MKSAYPLHLGPDAYLDLERAVAVSKDDVRRAWDLTYSKLDRALVTIPKGGKLYLVFGLQGSGKSTWIRDNLTKLRADSIFLDGPLPSRKQRAKPLSIARSTGVETVGVWINVSLETALYRNALRKGLACIKTEAILHVQSLYEAPSFEEGFSEIVEVRI